MNKKILIENIKSFEDDLKLLSNNDLVNRVNELFQKEKRIGDVILIGLKEIKFRQVYAWLGFSSLFEMLVKYYKLSESGAYARLAALKLIESVPEAQNLLIEGKISLSTLAETQTFINKTEKQEGLKISNEVKKEIVFEIQDKSLKETRELLAEKNESAYLPNDISKKITKSVTLVTMKLDDDNIKLIETVKNLLSHKIPDGNWNDVMRELLNHTIKSIKKNNGTQTKIDSSLPTSNINPTDCSVAIEKQTKLDEDDLKTQESKNCKINKKTNTNTNTNTNPSRYISLRVRRIVLQKAHYQCQYVSPEGRKCESKHRLEINHIKPFSLGGSNAIENLNVLCKTHNNFNTQNTHGFLYKSKSKFL